MKQIQLRQSMLLLLTALIWGTAFVAQQVGMDYMGPFAFSAVRFTMGGIVLIPVVLLLRRLGHAKENPNAARILSATIRGGILCGLILFVGGNLQQFGVQYTTVGKTGFLTALYIIFVPLIGLFMQRRAGAKLWVSVGIAVCGLYLLCMKDSFFFSKGDTLVLLCAVVFAVHILVIDHFIPVTDGVLMSCIQFFVSGALSLLAMLLFEAGPSLTMLMEARVPLLYAGVLSCGVAYTLQIIGQKSMNPTVASLILSLESVIAVIAAWIILHQGMTQREMLGAALMFLAILLAQLPGRQKKPTLAETQTAR